MFAAMLSFSLPVFKGREWKLRNYQDPKQDNNKTFTSANSRHIGVSAKVRFSRINRKK